MQVFDEIKKIINSNKNYIYQRIINYINNIPINCIIKNINQPTKSNSLEYEIEASLIKFILAYSIKTEFIKKEKFSMKEMEKYFNNIINFLENKNKDLRLFHIKILKNLLISDKGIDIIINYVQSNDDNIFTLSDFIINYSKQATIKLFNKDFIQNDLNELNNLYLYLILKINDEECLKKVKILIYTYLYEKKDINEFILKSSEYIVNNSNIDNKILKEFEIKFNEINLNINEIPKEIISLIGKDFMQNNDDLLHFFNKDNILNNYNYMTEVIKNNNINEKIIVVDDLNYDKNKIHLFSTAFLIANGLKSNLEKCDFEIFNEDNFSEDKYSKFLDKIIEEINMFMNKNKFKNVFIQKHLIKFHKKDFIHYLSVICNNNDKTELEENYINKRILKEASEIKEDNNSNKNKNELIIIKVKKNKEKNLNENENDEKNKESSFSPLSGSFVPSVDSFVYFLQYSLENAEKFINSNLINNISTEKLIYFPNILYMLNLKIPKYNEASNSIEFESVHIDSFDEDQKFGDNDYYYGCKYIDSIYYNFNENFIDFNYLGSFHSNLKYEIKNYFENTEEDVFNFLIYPKSLFFYDIRIKFPSTSIGREKIIKLKIDKIKEKTNNIIYYNEYDDDETIIPYAQYLRNLIKKFLFFFDTFKDNKELNDIINIQIVLVYDYLLIDKKVLTKEKADKFKMINKKIVFHLYFFDFKKMDALEKERKIEENKKIIEEKNKQIEEKNKQIKELERQLKEKSEQIKDSKFNKLVEKIIMELNSNNNLSYGEKFKQLEIWLKDYYSNK